MLPAVPIDAFISDTQTLGRWFSGPSWSPWKLLLRGAFGHGSEFTARELYQFYELADRSPPLTRVKELWACVGRRGGKDSIASAICCYLASLTDVRPFLRPGERASILAIAVNREQAKIQFSYIKSYFELCPLLKPLVKSVNESDGVLELRNSVEIVVATNSYRSVRGKSILACVASEISFWRSEDSANPDYEVFSAIKPGMMTLSNAGAMFIAISSVHRRAGLLYDRFREFHGQDSDDILVIRAPSRTFNPTLDQAEIDREVAADPEKNSAEYLSEWRSDLADYVSREVIDSCVTPGVFERGYNSRHLYLAAVDPSGGSSDSFALCIAHAEGDRAVVDCIHEIRAPFQPELATEQLVDTLRRYKVSKVVGDKYAGLWPREQFQKRGCLYEVSERHASDCYREFLPLLNSGRVDLIDNQRLVTQLTQLERRVIRTTGRETISHPLGSHDDVSVVCAMAATLLVTDDRGAVVKRYLLRGAGLI